MITTPDIISEKLQNANQLFSQGLYFKALDVLNAFEKKKDLTPKYQVSCHILKSNIYYELGEYTDALKLAEQACSMSQELGNNSLIFDSYISKGWTSLELRDLNTVSYILTKGEDLLKDFFAKSQSEFSKRDALLKLIKSQFWVYKDNNIDKALEYGEQGLKILEEYGNEKEITLALELNAHYYLRLGNLDRASDYLERCLRIQKTYRKRDDWLTLQDLGALNGIRGELDLALEYTKQSLAITEEMGNKNYIARCLHNLSLIYRGMGNLDYAKVFLERSLTIWEEIGNKRGIFISFDTLFLISLDANSLTQAEQYLLQMKEISEEINTRTFDMMYRVDSALLLKMSSNYHDQEKAKEILQQIVEDEIIKWEVTERALLYLCEIFLLELQTSNNQEILSDINLLINRMLDFAEFEHSYRLLAEANLLRGKVALIQMNMGDAGKLFTKAEHIADEHGLRLLARTISSEHDKLLEQLEIWEDLRKVKAPVSERLKLVDIDTTLNQMKGKQMMEPPDLVEEDPIFLVIMSEAGNVYFNHTFIKNWDYSDLFSSFISAFNTFSSEIFAKSIDRIKIGENIIYIKPVEPFLACYVSKGQSYPAIKKLNKFSHSIKNKKEIWDLLNKAAKISGELGVNSSPLLEAVVNEIFGVLSI